MLATTQLLVLVAREFTITVTVSFGILNTILWAFFKTSTVSSIPPTRLLQLVVACTALVFVFFACMMGIFHLVFLTRAEPVQEPEDGQIGFEKHKVVEEMSPGNSE